MLDEIVKELQMSSTSPATIAVDKVREWMLNNDQEVLGATYAIVTTHTKRIAPPLAFEEIFGFLLRYYTFCLERNPESAWANSRYSAGWDLVGWFNQLWNDQREKKYLDVVKAKLKDLYVTGDAELQKCIEHAILEHLFERKQIRKYFSEWECDSGVAEAYKEATRWVSRGGRSSLTSE